jgi:hypothetical protein
MTDYDYITIEPVPERETCYGGDHRAYGHGTYPQSSVLAGHSSRVFLGGGSVEELQAEFPGADVLDHSSKAWSDPNGSLADHSGLPSCAPGWFDPMAAGERWDDDY